MDDLRLSNHASRKSVEFSNQRIAVSQYNLCFCLACFALSLHRENVVVEVKRRIENSLIKKVI
jgi:hypothetical protein